MPLFAHIESLEDLRTEFWRQLSARQHVASVHCHRALLYRLGFDAVYDLASRALECYDGLLIVTMGHLVIFALPLGYEEPAL